MEIIIGKTAGFCYGVKNAVEKSVQELQKGKKICCLGEIVHNKQVVEKLKKQGIQFIDSLEENTEKKKTVIRAHGVSKEIYDNAKNVGIELLDLTCPMVLKIHDVVKEYKSKDYYIFVVGAKNHPEIIGTVGFCGKNFSVIENELDIDNAVEEFKRTGINKLAVVVQTTYSLETFKIISEKIKEKCIETDIEIINTICNATRLRQDETAELSKKVDFMIIIGGKNSSNTRKLFEIANKSCTNTVCIETFNELDINEIKKYKKIGIMAGASTPQESIQDVVNLLENA